MKLELKHLAGYLPYNLKYKCNGVVYYYEHCSTRDFDYENSKPILRQLSDLTKEIEVDREKFFPLYVLQRLDKSFIADFVEVFGIEECKFSVVKKLLEWHFDIYGLIENNLAIDINTLNKNNE